jgi:hypothetical protein
MGPRTRRPSPAGATCLPTCRTGRRSTDWTRISRPRGSRVVGPVARLTTADRISAGRTRLADRAATQGVRFRRVGRADLRRGRRRDPELSRAFWDRTGRCRGARWRKLLRRRGAGVPRHRGAYRRSSRRGPHRRRAYGRDPEPYRPRNGLGLEPALGHRIDPLSVTRLDRTDAGWSRHAGQSHRLMTLSAPWRLTAAPRLRPMRP